MTRSRNRSSSSFNNRPRVSADLCLHLATARAQAGSAAASAIRIVDRISAHHLNSAVSGMLSLVFILKTPFNTQ
jgi:hypothetical protein